MQHKKIENAPFKSYATWWILARLSKYKSPHQKYNFFSFPLVVVTSQISEVPLGKNFGGEKNGRNWRFCPLIAKLDSRRKF